MLVQSLHWYGLSGGSAQVGFLFATPGLHCLERFIQFIFIPQFFHQFISIHINIISISYQFISIRFNSYHLICFLSILHYFSQADYLLTQQLVVARTVPLPLCGCVATPGSLPSAKSTELENSLMNPIQHHTTPYNTHLICGFKIARRRWRFTLRCTIYAYEHMNPIESHYSHTIYYCSGLKNGMIYHTIIGFYTTIIINMNPLVVGATIYYSLMG